MYLRSRFAIQPIHCCLFRLHKGYFTDISVDWRFSQESTHSCLTYSSLSNECKRINSFLLCVPWQDQQICHLRVFSLSHHHQQRPAETKSRSTCHNWSKIADDKWHRKKGDRPRQFHRSVLNLIKNNVQTWLILGWAFVFFFEVVSRPQREENLLLRLLHERDIACVRRLTPISVRAATCKNITAQSGLKHTNWATGNNLLDLMSHDILNKKVWKSLTLLYSIYEMT